MNLKMLTYNTDPQDLWAILATDGKEINDSLLRRAADNLLNKAIADSPEEQDLIDGFWDYSFRPLDDSRILLRLQPDTVCGRISSHVEQYYPVTHPSTPSNMTFEQARAACTL